MATMSANMHIYA